MIFLVPNTVFAHCTEMDLKYSILIFKDNLIWINYSGYSAVIQMQFTDLDYTLPRSYFEKNTCFVKKNLQKHFSLC